jgi:redox-sensitive bicupin YhaK (pirin superfamily)
METKYSSGAAVFAVQRSGERAYFDHGWLQTRHSFSFADYYDASNVQWGALRVLNDDVVKPGEGFDSHPHRDMEILTYVLEGQLEHRDSTGSHGVVGPGGVQFMSAGTGVTHSEYNHSKTDPLHFLQMWVQPGKVGAKPSYGQVELADSDRLNHLQAVASGRSSVSAPIQLTQDAAFFVTRLEEGHHVRHTFEPRRFGFLFIADGSFEAESELSQGVAAQNVALGSGDAVRIANIARLTLHGSGIAVLWDVPH